MSPKPQYFADLDRRYVESDWVNEFQRLWAIFNHWLVKHVRNQQDRACIEALKTFPETKRWIQSVTNESAKKKSYKVSDGLFRSYQLFSLNSIISILFRESSKSPIIEPRINYPWRVGSEPRVKVINTISLSESEFISAYRAHAEMLQENMPFNLNFHQSLDVIGIHSTGCCFFKGDPDPSLLTIEAKHCAAEMVKLFRTKQELSNLVSLIDSHEVTSIAQDTIEMLYNIRNTAIHGSLDFLNEADNLAARAGCDVIDSLIRDILDKW